MKQIYITGHGLMSLGYGDSVILRHALHTYCAAGRMLEGGVGSTSIVDHGDYQPRDQSSRNDAKYRVFKPGESVPTHYVYGATSVLSDYNNSVKLAAARQMPGGLQKNKILLDNSAGQLFKLNDGEYLYCTMPATLTALNKIQSAVELKLPGKQCEFHWVACRSHIPTGSGQKILQYAKNEGVDGAGLKTLVR